MSARSEEGALRAWAFALALIVLCLPIHSPDLFWHLSAGRWIAAQGLIPTSDPFSFTRFGAPWIDFEWLAQILWYGIHEVAGLRGLWALKAAMLVAVFIPIDGLMRDKGASPTARAAGLALWSCAALASADLRVDLFSAGLFALLLRRLEAGKASFLFGFTLFTLWGNLHAGFPLGLALYAAYAIFVPRPAALGAEFCGALLGTLLNPYGLEIYRVIVAHGHDSIGRYVREWGPVDWRMGYHRPLIAALIGGTAASWAARRHAPALAAVTVALALVTVVSSRFGIYFAAAAAGVLAVGFPRPHAFRVAGGLVLASMLLGSATRNTAWGRAFSDVYVARRAVNFVAAERDAFGPLRVYNTYEWGGYLGWCLGRNGLVYGDGRYLFHSQLFELETALTGAGPMNEFVGRNRFDALLIRNYPTQLRGELSFPDGARVTLTRPWYASYLPRSRWALVYWDEQALVFVDRAKVATGWLSAHEYRWVRPGDEEALIAALSHGLAPAGEVSAERARRTDMPR